MSDPAPVEFEVIAADVGTEIFLIDGTFRLLKKGIGQQKFSVRPGIYKIKARSGKTATEKMLIVRPGMEPVRLEPVKISSAMPLLNSAKTHEFHIEAARQASATPTLSIGEGSAIVIVVRQWTAPEPVIPSTPAPLNPARGLTLRDMRGTLIVDIEEQTRVSTSFDPCVAVHVALNPGAYRLALAYEGGRRIEQTLIACHGWQTHIYLLVSDKVDTSQPRADLVNGAITMRKPGIAFDAGDPMLRLEEIARGALVDNRKILSDAVRSAIASRDCPPMLALLGAHLLILEAKEAKRNQEEAPDQNAPVIDNREQVRTIVENLRASIGQHPDVEAIALGAGKPNPAFVFEAPPLFRASWLLLLKASAGQPGLFPDDSFGARIAERIWGEGSWLLWLDPDTSDGIDRARLWQVKAREMLSSITVTSSRVGDPGKGSQRRPPISTGIVARLTARLKSLVARRSRTPFPVLHSVVQRAIANRADVDLAALRDRLTDDQRQSLIKTLGVPMSSVNAWLDQLSK